ncbi:hypothetical protein OESDEN_22424 [Oesophagostomum dentatum]|uniref:PH domain-containing protein n=1 Tax=Oesophagostomum dentatum TaxID=61180 RepID=A0A0B1S246_OESDE|nr:hypothetical protein OESDEN_22424 [Oesophagostomum dentatum]
MQSTSIENDCGVVSQSAAPFLTLARCWQCLPARITKDRAFVTLVTSAFPTVKEQDKLYKELEEASFFDCFSLDGPSNRWSCFSCSHPDRVKSFVEDGSQRVLEGQLKEKKGRWRFLRRWHTKYFTLSSAALTCSSEQAVGEKKFYGFLKFCHSSVSENWSQARPRFNSLTSVQSSIEVRC